MYLNFSSLAAYGGPTLRRFAWRWVVAAVIAAFVSGCASERPAASSFPRHASYALPASTPTPLSAAVAAAARAHPGESGFQLLVTGSDALRSRIALLRSAQRTLDIQYYIAEQDRTGKLLLEAILRAAERGVRVRILLDDMNFKDAEHTLGMLNGMRNVEIRVFNPFSTRDETLLRRTGNLVTHLDTLTRRMHNKAIIADSQAAITGGRNLGDSYFDASNTIAFRDIDVLSLGPVVPQIAASFDVFWNSEQSYPLKALQSYRVSPEDAVRLRDDLRQHWRAETAITGGDQLDEAPLAHQLRTGELALIWAPATFSSDSPAKITVPTSQYISPPALALEDALEHAKHEVLIMSPYFVPHDTGIDFLGALTARGVRVAILTNSLAATDAPAVQAGYSPARVPLLERGVELYEFKPIAGHRTPGVAGSHSRASLHAKAYVVDRRYTVIGSLNLDPRSFGLNTELEITIDSPQIAERVAHLFADASSPDQSYRVELADHATQAELTAVGAPPSPLVWVSTENGHPVRYNFDPEAGLWRNTLSALFFILPLQNQL